MPSHNPWNELEYCSTTDEEGLACDLLASGEARVEGGLFSAYRLLQALTSAHLRDRRSS